mmetsp:Transcript_22132/g.35598  ORF Transcript_22132/g.35598 Transcript_22132/m.35598 type:complete len:317 (-) Transcript_22132:141-1091(-)
MQLCTIMYCIFWTNSSVPARLPLLANIFMMLVSKRFRTFFAERSARGNTLDLSTEYICLAVLISSKSLLLTFCASSARSFAVLFRLNIWDIGITSFFLFGNALEDAAAGDDADAAGTRQVPMAHVRKGLILKSAMKCLYLDRKGCSIENTAPRGMKSVLLIDPPVARWIASKIGSGACDSVNSKQSLLLLLLVVLLLVVALLENGWGDDAAVLPSELDRRSFQASISLWTWVGDLCAVKMTICIIALCCATISNKPERSGTIDDSTTTSSISLIPLISSRASITDVSSLIPCNNNSSGSRRYNNDHVMLLHVLRCY